MDIERSYTGWVALCQPIVFPKDEIEDVKIVSFVDGDTKDKTPIVRVYKKTPTIEFVCVDATEAMNLFKFLSASKKVVNLDECRRYLR